MQIHGLYTLDLSGHLFELLRRVKPTFLEGNTVDEDRLRRATRRTLDPLTAEVFGTTIDSTLFFFKNPKHTFQSSQFLADSSEKLIEMSINFNTHSSCGPEDKSVLVYSACEWRSDVLEIPFDTPPLDPMSHRIYLHGEIQFFPDLVNSVLIVRSCLGLPDDSPRPELVTELKKIVALPQLSLTIAGGDSFTLKVPSNSDLRELPLFCLPLCADR
jgi:hypothetical protein